MAARTTSAALREGRLTKAEAEERWLTRSLDPRKDRGLIEWLAETTLLGGVSSLAEAKWPRPKLVWSNEDKREA